MTNVFLMAAVIAMAAEPGFAQQEVSTLRLRCEGTATKRLDVAGEAPQPATVGPAVFRLELTGAAGRVLIPRAYITIITTGSKDGWFPLNDVAYSDTEIRGVARMNPINRASIRIDRIAGDIEVRGSGGYFSGKCRPETTAEKLF